MSPGNTRGKVYISGDKPATKKNQDISLSKLDKRLGNIQHNIPKIPNLLTISARRQYHLSEYQQEELKVNECGFAPEERDLQFVSFLNTGWDKTIFEVLKAEKKKKGSAKVMASTAAPPKTVTKKISIADYKERKSLPNTANGPPAVDNARNRASSTSGQANTMKRSADALEKSKLSIEEPSSKKLKPSPKLGPSNDQSFKPLSKFTLPPPLSPTLPAFVEKLLAKKDETTQKPNNTETDATQKKVSKPESSKAVKSSSQDSAGARKPDAVKASSQTSVKQTNGVHRGGDDAQSKPKDTTDSDTIKLTPIAKDKSVSKPSVIVRIKIPRNMRNDISRILRLTGKRPKERTPIPKLNANSQGEKTIPDRLTAKTGEKRPREDNLDMQREKKKQKSPTPASQDRPASKKPREITPPAKEEVSTPQAAITGTPVPPSSVSRKPQDKQTPSEAGSTTSATSERIEGLRLEERKYSDLGRELKRESDKLNIPDSTPAQKRKYLASRIEVTLSFMLSYTVGDEVNRLRRQRPRPKETWGTLHAWIQSVHSLVTEHPHLSGLLLQLEAICTMVMWRQRSELVEKNEGVSMDKFKALKAQYDDAHRKLVKGTARLSIDDLQDEFPKTWRAKARLPLAHAGYEMTKDNLSGEFYLPLTSTSLPIEGVRAAKMLLTEWCKREGVDWVAKLEF